MKEHTLIVCLLIKNLDHFQYIYEVFMTEYYSEYYLFFLGVGDPSRICFKLDKSSDILKCLPDKLYFVEVEHSSGDYMMSEPFNTPDPQGFAQEFSHKLIELAETDEEVKEILGFRATEIELQQRYSMNTWNIFGSERRRRALKEDFGSERRRRALKEDF